MIKIRKPVLVIAGHVFVADWTYTFNNVLVRCALCGGTAIKDHPNQDPDDYVSCDEMRRTTGYPNLIPLNVP